MTLTLYNANGLKKAPSSTIYDTDQVGTVKAWAGATIPANWMLCDGRPLSRLSYADLFNALGGAASPWGLPDASSFNIPDLRSKMIVGAGPGSAGAPALGAGLTARTMQQSGGEEKHLLATGEAAQKAVTSDVDTPDHFHGTSKNGFAVWRSGDAFGPGAGGAPLAQFVDTLTGGATARHTHTIAGSGAVTAHENMPPWCAVAWIIKVQGVQVDAGTALAGPAGAAGASGGQSYTAVIGDALNTAFTVQHGFNTKNVTVSVYRTATPWDEVECDVERTDQNNLTIRTTPIVPAAGELTVVVAAPGTQSTLNVAMDSWHAVGAAGEPAFQSGVTNQAGDTAVAFRKYPDGRVRIRGCANTGAVSTQVFTLPVGYRPPTDWRRFMCADQSGNACYVYITAGGAVMKQTASNANVDLSTIEFDTESVAQTASVAAVPIDTVHYVGAPGEPAFTNGWMNYDNSAATPGTGSQRSAWFRKYPDGKVRVGGCIKSGTINAAVFTLPVGYRPRGSNQDWAANCGGAFGAVRADSGGAIVVEAGSNAYAFLDPIEFETETVGAYAAGAIGPSLITSLPVAPFDGQEVYFLADSTNGVIWHLRYRAASASAYKWEFVGGSEWFAQAPGTQSFTNTTMATQANRPSDFTLPLSGDYMIEFGGRIYTQNGNGYSLDLAEFVGSNEYGRIQHYQGSAGASITLFASNFQRLVRPTGVAAGSVLQQRCAVNAGTGFMDVTYHSIRPVRVG